MNIDMTQERDGGRVSSPAQQQPDKLRRGGATLLEGLWGLKYSQNVWTGVLNKIYLYATFEMLSAL